MRASSRASQSPIDPSLKNHRGTTGLISEDSLVLLVRSARLGSLLQLWDRQSFLQPFTTEDPPVENLPATVIYFAQRSSLTLLNNCIK